MPTKCGQTASLRTVTVDQHVKRYATKDQCLTPADFTGFKQHSVQNVSETTVSKVLSFLQSNESVR
jgi:hypothetical protein